ncbi:MAG: hypothetical protein ACLU0O_07105 [Collinsella sp.]
MQRALHHVQPPRLPAARRRSSPSRPSRNSQDVLHQQAASPSSARTSRTSFASSTRSPTAS